MLDSLTMTKRTYEREAGKQARAAILAHLAEHGESTTRELAELLPIAKSTVHQHIRRLRAAGYVRTHYGRTGRVELTEAGRLALQN